MLVLWLYVVVIKVCSVCGCCRGMVLKMEITKINMNLQDHQPIVLQATREQNQHKVLLEFKNITCTINLFCWNRLRFEKKKILKGVSGSFKPGELTAIMGSSGSGKTTLLNILAGYSTTGADGEIRINGIGVSASQSNGRGGAKYIQQENNLRPLLTVYESMYYAAALKLADINYKTRHKKIIGVLSDLNLIEKQSTLCVSLSGGQMRRVGVAMELLTDPSLLFLDEPLTGLDSASSTSLVMLLSKLAKSGKTIIITIHQPSGLMFEQLDKIHCLANGKTLFNGPRKNLVPALKHAELSCPAYHSPTDLLIEIASMESETSVEKAALKMLEYNRDTAEKSDTSTLDLACTKNKMYRMSKMRYNPSYLKQTLILIKRTYLIASRNPAPFVLRVTAYLILAFLIGTVYSMYGKDASTIIGNMCSIYSCTIMSLYGALMYVTLLMLQDIEILKLEYFNRWYKLEPYLISFLAVELPFQIIITAVFAFVCYYLTGNPLEYKRVTLYVAAMVFVTLSAQAWGLFLASTTSMKIAVLVGPMISCIYSIYAFSITYASTPYVLKWLYNISYFRAAAQTAAYAIYGMDRGKLACKKEYCYYTDPRTFLRDLEIASFNVIANVGVVVSTAVVMYALTYAALYIRLNKR